MAVLVWKHGTTADAAGEAIRAELDRLGHGGKVKWTGDEASASVGWGLVLSAAGRVTDEAVVLDTCGGAVGGLVLAKCRELLARLFPDGEQVEQTAM
jgi:hypothetical protein